jgi:hypothetical protein
MNNLNEILSVGILVVGSATFIICAFWTLHNFNKDDKNHKIKKA